MAGVFIGRKQELEALYRYTKKPTASLIVAKGRRRIGKSRLIEQFAKKYRFLSFSGLAPKLSEIDKNFYQWKSLEVLPAWAGIMGLQFENLVLNNRSFIHHCLKLSTDDIVVENH